MLLARWNNKRVKVFCYIPLNSGTEKSYFANFVKEVLLGFNIKKNMSSITIWYCTDSKLENLLRKHKIDIVLPLFSTEINLTGIPYIGYIPDVQHKHYKSTFLCVR